MMKKNKNKQLMLQQHPQQYDAYPSDQQHHSEGNVGQQRQSYQKPGHKAKGSGLNQSMDAGINNYAQTFSAPDGGQKLYIHSQDSYHQNYVSNTFDKTTSKDGPSGQANKPTHFRSGSHAVGGGGQQVLKGSKQYSAEMQALIHQQQALLKMSGSGHGELSQAQLAQMASLQQNSGFVATRESERERTQQQKAKRKHNMSQNIQIMPHEMGKQGGVVQQLQHSFMAPHESQQLSSKRGYGGGPDKQANRAGKQNYQAQQAQHTDSQNQFESARYNSIGALHATTQMGTDPNASALLVSGQEGTNGKERFQGTQKVGKKGSKISGGQGGSIILSAGTGVQGVPQLKSQFNKGHHTQTHQNKSSQHIPISHSINQTLSGQQHQRVNSDSQQLGANMRSGFNSASNAAIQQQAQIVQIYQQQNSGNVAGHNTASMAKMKYHTNNSRKVIPMLQQNQVNQVVSHHKRTTQHMQQLSRDRDGKGLMESSQSKFVADSYPQGNYQTYSLNYNSGPSQQLQGVHVRKSQVADTSRANRIASREQAQRRAMMGGDMNSVKVIHGELNSSYNQMTGAPSGLAIPQKKQKSLQSQKLKPAHGHNASFHNGSNQGSFNQTTTQGFFNDSSTNQTHGAEVRSKPGSSNKAGPGSNTIKHQKSGSQYTPQLTQSLKHTINSTAGHDGNQHMNMHNIENVQLQTKKSGPIQQTHVRQTSVQVAVDSNQNKKLSIQHRKNKSVLNNQIRINPSLQNPGQAIKMRAHQDHQGGKQKINQYFDNYTDTVQPNFYSQQAPHQQSNLNVTHQAQALIKGSNKNLSNASLKHNLTQSSHRKNKTSVIGSGPNKMLGINSSSVFQAPSSLIGAENAHAATMKKIVGGTISHSHKSLRSQSSNRKRVASMDSSGALEKGDKTNKYHMPISHSSKKSSGAHSGQLTPDLSSYNNVNSSKHQQKVQKFLSNQAGGPLRQQLKPQGNIVIQQQQQQQPGANATAPPGGVAMTQHQANLKSSQGNRRHASLLKGEHQDKSLVYIGQDHQVTSAQAQIARFGKHQQQDGARHQNQSPDLGEDSSSMRGANNLVFVDGGTGGGSQKPKARQFSENREHSKYEKSLKQGQYSSGKRQQVADNDDYNLQRELKNRDRSSGHQMQQIPKQSSKILHKTKNRFDGMDAQDVNMPDDLEVNLDRRRPAGANRSKDIGSRRPGSSHPRGQTGAREKADKARMQDASGGELDYSQSINITKEALEKGKVPPERIAEMIADSGHTLTRTDTALSPRTREIVGISNLIRKSFLQKGDAPKTTPEFYRAGKMLGRGAFGKVSLGMHKLSRKLVALKSINKEFMTDEKSKSKVMHEVGILLRLRHKSVVKLYETFETKRHMLLAMELCAGGDLLNYVRKRKKLDEGVSKVIFRQIIDGLGYIHKKRILHRDIKLDNILLDGKGNVKIADFGVSKLVKPGDVMHEQSGTPAYIAPEILREEGYAGFKADIWSAGVVLYAMLCGTVPFKASNMKELHKMIIKGKYHLKEEVSDEAKSLMKAMLNTDPSSRISITKILEHPWMQLPDEPIEIFNQEERDVVKKEFIYNNPKQPNRSEAINEQVEPWDCFTELNLDSINEVLRNESEKSVILAPFNSSLSDFNEDEWAGMDAGLIIHRLFDDAAPLEDKKDMVRFAARCRDQDRQYEINNNGELDNGVYHKFVYSSRDGQPEPSSSVDAGGSIEGLRPMSSRNMNKKGSDENIFKKELDKQKQAGRRFDSEVTAGADEYGLEDSYESAVGVPGAIAGGVPPDLRMIETLINFGYPEDYLRFCLAEGEASYCLAAYYLLCEDQQY